MNDWRRHVERRDMLVREARDAGIDISEISRCMGITRPTVYKILGAEQAGK